MPLPQPPPPPQAPPTSPAAQLQPATGGDQVVPSSDSESDMDVEEAGFYDGGGPDRPCTAGEVPQQ